MSDAPDVLITVFTPTYNRGETLVRVWDSLCAQTWRRFEWLVVDDGSTDGTRELVKNWAALANFPVRYLWQANQHKKTAINYAVREAAGALVLGFDSDDSCPQDALERFWKAWSEIPEAERAGFVGVTGLCCDTRGEIVGDRFPCEEFIDSTGSEMLHRWRVRGEKWGVLRTEVMREFPFPEDVKGYVPESYVWRQMELRYQTRFVNQVLRIYHDDLSDSVMVAGKRAPWEDADGCTLGFAMDLRVGVRWLRHDPLGLLRVAANVVRQALHSSLPVRRLADELWSRQSWAARLLLFLSAPVGVAVWARDLCRDGMAGLKAHREAVRSARRVAQV